MQASPHRRSSNPIPLRTHRNLSHQTPTHHLNNKICSQSSTFFSMPRGQPSGLFFECGSEAPAFTHLTPPPVPSTSAPTPKFVILSPRLMRAKDLNTNPSTKFTNVHRFPFFPLL